MGRPFASTSTTVECSTELQGCSTAVPTGEKPTGAASIKSSDNISNEEALKPSDALEGAIPERVSVYAELWRLWQFLNRGERRRLGVSLVALIVSSASNLSFPAIMGTALDYASSPGGLSTHIEGTTASRIGTSGLLSVLARINPSHNKLILGVLGIMGIGGLSSYLRVYALGMVSHSIQRRLRASLYRVFMLQEMESIETQKTGDLMDRLSSDTENASAFVTQSSASALRSMNSALGGTVVLLALSRKLTIVTLALVPLLGAGAMLYGMYAKKLSRALKSKLAFALGRAEERLNKLVAVRVYGQEGPEIRYFDRSLGRLHDCASKMYSADGGLMGGMSVAVNLSLLAVLYFGGTLLRSQQLTVGKLTSFCLYSSMVGLGFSGLCQVYADMVKNSASVSRVFKYIDEKAASAINTQGTCLDKVKGKIEFKSVTYRYASRPTLEVLKNLSFSIQPGEVVAIAGASGSGKTTIANLITRMYELGQGTNEGSIFLDDADVRTLNSTWLRQRVFGVVTQEPAIFQESILYNLLYAVGLPQGEDELPGQSSNALYDELTEFYRARYPNGLQTADCGELSGRELETNNSDSSIKNAVSSSGQLYPTMNEIEAVLKRCNAYDFVSTLPENIYTSVTAAQLSTGQKQRLAIARAMLKDPPCLILDEATSALDGDAERMVQTALERLMKDRTVLMIAHRTSTLKYASRILVLKEGIITAIGTYEELLSTNQYFGQLVKGKQSQVDGQEQ